MKSLIKKIFNLIGYAIVKKGHCEQPVIELSDRAKKLFGNIKVNKIVDIGANEGQFALDINAAFPSARFFCFEPLKDVFIRLKDKITPYDNFILYNVGLGAQNGIGTFNHNEYSPSSSMLDMNDIHKDNFSFARSTYVEHVEIKCLDDYFSIIYPDIFTLVKIDVQGYEDKVLDGGSSFIREAGYVLIEMSFRELYQGQKLFGDIYSRMIDMGFEYIGCIDQLISPVNDEILQADSLFRNSKLNSRI